MTKMCEFSCKQVNKKHMFCYSFIPFHYLAILTLLHYFQHSNHLKSLFSFYTFAIESLSSCRLAMSTSPHPARCPYSTVLSALCKMDLIWLSLEFRLPTNSSVINLRSHLRCYLNFNHGTLAQNPGYAALFPKHKCANQPLASHLLSNTLCMSPPALLYHNLSLTPSFTSWHSIEDEPCGNQPHPSPQP